MKQNYSKVAKKGLLNKQVDLSQSLLFVAIFGHLSAVHSREHACPAESRDMGKDCEGHGPATLTCPPCHGERNIRERMEKHRRKLKTVASKQDASFICFTRLLRERYNESLQDLEQFHVFIG